MKCIDCIGGILTDKELNDSTAWMSITPFGDIVDLIFEDEQFAIALIRYLLFTETNIIYSSRSSDGHR
jgi:hypothetical protein